MTTTAKPFPRFVDDVTIPLFERMAVEKINEAIEILEAARAWVLDRVNAGNDIRIGQTYGQATAVRSAAYGLRMTCQRDECFVPTPSRG